MFGELQLKNIHTELIMEDYLVRAIIQPRGSMSVFLNEKQWPFIPVNEAEMYPLAVERQVNSIKRPIVVINKKYIKLVLFTDEEEAKGEQLLVTSRPVALYTSVFAIQGQLHVNQDAHDQKLLDESRDYFAMSDASIYPIRKVLTPPTRHVPLLFFSRELVRAYHPIERPG